MGFARPARLICLFAFAFGYTEVGLGKPPQAGPVTMRQRAESLEKSNDYVHRWLKMPVLSGRRISGGEGKVGTTKGKISVVVFLAPWDVRSQEFISSFKQMEKNLGPLDVNFHYAFTHSTYDDAAGFAKEFNLNDGILTGHDANKAFHNPRIPSIYVADRHGWLTNRFLDIKHEQIPEISAYLTTLAGI